MSELNGIPKVLAANSVTESRILLLDGIFNIFDRSCLVLTKLDRIF